MLFIHQYPDWTNFRYQPQPVLNALAKCRFAQGRLCGKTAIALGESSSEQVRERDLEALFQIDGRRTESERTLRAALRNYSTPLSEERLLAIHAAVVRGGGSYRLGSGIHDGDESGALQGFYGVPADRIPREVAKFILFFNNDETDPVLQAAIAHFWFVTIRPFEYGNGIVARLVTDMLISRGEGSSRRYHSIFAQIGADKDAYFKTLAEAQRSNGDITGWILWHLQETGKSIAEAEKDWTAEISKAAQRLSLSAISLSDRERRLVEFVTDADDAGISSSTWAKEAGVSHDSALRDLLDLTRKGVFEKRNAGGRSTRYRLKL